jgi:hypothetical protein
MLFNANQLNKKLLGLVKIHNEDSTVKTTTLVFKTLLA